RRSGDTGELFYETLVDRFEEMMAACELEPIAPEPGEAYQNSLHNAVRVVRAGEPSRRDTGELCLGRGFRWRGRRLRKAEVRVYLGAAVAEPEVPGVGRHQGQSAEGGRPVL